MDVRNSDEGEGTQHQDSDARAEVPSVDPDQQLKEENRHQSSLSGLLVRMCADIPQ
jgi:hypothetical protein